MTEPSGRRRRRRSHGQGLVEFALIAPVALLVIVGIVVGCLLFFQSSAVHDGATAGARMASIETSLIAPLPLAECASGYGESGTPMSIEKAVAQAAPGLKVNTAALCKTSSSQLMQTPQANVANITVTANTDLGGPRTVTVTVSFAGQGIAPPLTSTYAMSATSTVPVLAP
ncbi:MAG: TadE family protein [Candidatus Dormibacteria bacterium]